MRLASWAEFALRNKIRRGALKGPMPEDDRKKAVMRIELGWARWLCACAVVGVLALMWMSATASGVDRAGPAVAPSFRPEGEPLILASDGSGGIWYGGAAVYVVSDEPEAEASVWHLSTVGRVTRIALPTKPVSRQPEYFAAGRNGVEWFLAGTDVNKSVELGSVSASGDLTLSAIPLERGARLRGLAVDSRGELWSTESGREGHRQLAGIVRIVPDGRVSVFKAGLMKGAIPENIAAGSDGALWFLDGAGRVGHVFANGRIREFPIGRRIAAEERPFAPARPILIAGQRVWFLAGPETIGRMTMSGRTSFITPHSSYRGIEALGASDGNLIGLARAPGGSMWFTRDSGEVGKIEPDGWIGTITNRLVNAYGIAFDGDGRAWVGEGPEYERENLGETPFERERERQMALPGIEPARVAEIDPSGRVMQFPAPPSCRVPSLTGVEWSLVWLKRALPFGEDDSEQSLSHCEHRIRLTHVTIRREGRRGRLFVVAQRPAPGRRTDGYIGVSVTLAVPRTPKRCGVPWPFKALFRSRRLVVWRVATVVPGNEGIEETYDACVPPNGKARGVTGETTGGPQGGGKVSRMRFAGHYIAYVTDYGSKYGSSEALTVENVAKGTSTEIETEGHASEYGGAPGPERLPDLERLGLPVGRGAFQMALAAAGEVAWVGRTEAAAGQPRQSVLYLHDGYGTRRLATAHQIGALHFSGRTLRWQTEGRTQSTRPDGSPKARH